MKISPPFQVVFVAMALLISADRLPAPISEQAPPPETEQHAKTKLKEKGTAQTGNKGFDGTWTGSEKMEKSWGRAAGHLDKSAEHPLFIIARNGTVIARLKGVCPGRFDNPANRNGGLYFSAGQNESYYSPRGYGQSVSGAKTEFELRLSDNGNTLISKIHITVKSSHYIKSDQLEGEALITGVYHRTTLDQATLKDAEQEIQKEFGAKK